MWPRALRQYLFLCLIDPEGPDKLSATCNNNLHKNLLMISKIKFPVRHLCRKEQSNFLSQFLQSILCSFLSFLKYSSLLLFQKHVFSNYFLLFYLFTFYPGFPVPPPRVLHPIPLCLWEGAPHLPLTYPPLYLNHPFPGVSVFLNPQNCSDSPKRDSSGFSWGPVLPLYGLGGGSTRLTRAQRIPSAALSDPAGLCWPCLWQRARKASFFCNLAFSGSGSGARV